jgi:DUF3089 family protein
MLRKFPVLFILSLIFFSCSDKFLPYKNQYSFKSEDGKPDFANLDYWAAHPWKKDLSDSIPLPLRQESGDSSADVFFLHPTMYTMKLKSKPLNASIDDSYLNAKTDYSSILYQASVFNQSCRVFAPRFREAHISQFFARDTVEAVNAFELAYEDIRTAFEYYLNNYNHGRPIIIAAHSQGSKHALRLLKDYFEDKPLGKQLVVAYLLGWQISKDEYKSLIMCEDSIQTGCICGWRTLREGYLPRYIKKEKGNSFVTNPLVWTIDEKPASNELNQGSVLFDFNKIYKNVSSARIKDNILWISKPKFPHGSFYLSKNYHAGDLNLFYMNLRENIRTRIQHFGSTIQN